MQINSEEMFMSRYALAVHGEDRLDDLLSLQRELKSQIDVRPVTTPGTGLEQGPLLQALEAVAAPGGGVVALITLVVTWLRARRHSLTVEITRPNGSVYKIDTVSVRAVRLDEVQDTIIRIARELEDSPAEDSQDHD